MNEKAPLESLDTDSIENVYIFVADSVRYDSVPDRVAEKGLLFKTAAAALCTPQSLPSILTGRYPPKHGVSWFNDSLPASIPTLFDLFDASGYNEIVWQGSALQDVLNNPGEVDIESVEEPFFVLEHDNGGHAPYSNYDIKTGEMFSQLSDTDVVRELYLVTVDESTERFEERFQLLESNNLLENTLVIYLADHGELLGEWGGFIGHSSPSKPEVVYVPTVFIHPSLNQGTDETFIQHVDLYPTIADIINSNKPEETDGDSLLTDVEKNRPAYTNGLMRATAKYRETRFDPAYDAPSIWTRDGGFVFNETARSVRPITATYDALFSGYTGSFNSGKRIPKILYKSFKEYLSSNHVYGNPSISIEKAEQLMKGVRNSSVESESRSLDEETKKTSRTTGVQIMNRALSQRTKFSRTPVTYE